MGRLWLLASVFSPSTLEKVGEASGTLLAHAANVVVNFEVVRLRVSKSALQVVPAKHRHQKIPPDWVKAVTTFAFVFGEFFINEGLFIFFFFPVARLSTWTFCPQGWGFIS